jgi:Uma2 family endonuclease
MAVKVLKRRFTVEEYYQMAQAGILTEDDRVELIEGEIVEMTPISSKHAACVNRLNRLFSNQVGRQGIVSVQNPIRLSEHSEPEPDLALLRPRPDFYADKHPEPGHVLLVVEVAETSQEYDRGVKMPLYAEAGLPEAWLVDLEAEIVESYCKSSAQGYKEVRKYQRGERLVSQAAPELELSVDEVLS